MIVKPDALTKRRGDAPEQVKPGSAALVNVGDLPPAALMNMKEQFEYQVGQLIPQAGTIELSKQQREILYAKVKDEDVEIRADGIIYLPWMEYVSRLREAFGMEWAIVPHGEPKINPDKDGILWAFFLMVKGKICGYSIGEQQYFPNNKTMTWGDACEGAKSNALMRLCKGIGISLELWRPSFVKAWIKAHAETYLDPKGKTDQWGHVKKLWRKKGTGPAGEGKNQQAKVEKKPPVQEKPAAKAEAQAKAKPAANAKYKTKPPPGRPSAETGPAGDDIADMAETQAPELDEAGKKKHLSNVQAVKLILEKDDIDYKDFKKFLAEVQVRSKSKRVFVRDKFNHPSLEAGNADDVAQLLNNLGVMMKKYIETRMKEEQDAKAKKKG